MYKNKELNWENDEFKVVSFDLEKLRRWIENICIIL